MAKLESKVAKRFTPAVKVIILFGVISMLGDMVYESARGANSQYFNLLSVSAAQVGLVFGIGEFLGYFLRLLAGVLSDKSGKHWIFIFVGYGMLLVVPIMGFTMNWNILIVLILMERIGKSLRNPAKDTILSGVAENQVGTGFAFGLQEALDQVGALTGPLIFTLVFFIAGKNGIAEYQLGYKWLFVPFILLMLFVVYAYRRIKRNNLIQDLKTREFRSERLQPIFWIYTAFTFFCTLGFVNFSIIGYHLKANNLMSDGNITLLYSGAMAVDAVAALLVGKAYDNMKKKTGIKTGGLAVLMAIPFITLLLPFLTISNSTPLIVIGMVIFGVVMGTHETIMRSAVADITPFYKRGTSFGVFNTGYGLALLIGSALMGWLYDMNQIGIIIAFTCVAEAIAVFLYFKMIRTVRTGEQ
ncbi:MAG: MFS transporter [Candidatus Pelethousia sp.]|nr:MFS transporter [Candidatus Pelethousia sp.]